MSTRLNAPYGGTLIQLLKPRASLAIAGLPVLTLNSVIESDVLNIGVGSFSPLTGFMGSKDFQSVCQSMRLVESALPWTIPIVFDLTEEQKRSIEGARIVVLKSATSGELIGAITPSEIYVHDKDLRIRSTYGVSDDAHPGVKLVRGMGPWLLAGEVTVFNEALPADPLAQPAAVRARLAEMGLSRVAGFQTRNVVHRAHEYLQRVALELCDGLLVHPMVGWKKSGDFKPEVVRHAYRSFIDAYYPKNRALLAFLQVAMRYAGPKEAVFHAIIRKNFGCSHFIVGRDHAGVGGYYGMYAAHEIFDSLPDLGITILKLRGPFYCSKCETIATDHSCGHDDSVRDFISGTAIRKILTEGSDPSNYIFRKEVLESLKLFAKEGFFYD